MADTQNLKLPYIMAAQAQKHVTHNEAIRKLDAIVQLGVLDRDLGTPPPQPQLRETDKCGKTQIGFLAKIKQSGWKK